MKRIIIAITIVGVAFIFLIPNHLISQQCKPESRAITQNEIGASVLNRQYWINGGLGVCSAGLSSGISFSHQTGKQLITVRSTYNEELNIFGPSPAERVWDVGVMYGRSAKSKYGFVSVSAGLGLVGGVKRGTYLGNNLDDGYGWFVIKIDRYEKDNFVTLGFPAEIQAFWTPFSKLGIGITLYGNFNPEKSFAGLMLCIQIGNLR